jgi:hypothetical protein
VFLISFTLGFFVGIEFCVKEVVKIGIKLIEIQKINVSIDENMITTGLMQYHHTINGCLFAK